MSFKFSDQHIEEYHTQGYTVFRRILPPSLLEGLRRVGDRARELARQENNPQAQRLQPLERDDLEQGPLIEYAELPALKDAITRLLSPQHRHGHRHIMGVLLEPAELPYCTAWHRDWRDNVAGLDLRSWDEHFADPRYFNQVNCALYAESCTWVVPGSHLRRDLPGEIARFPDRPIAAPDLDACSATERERRCLDYALSMPGAVQLHLEAGDFCLYRNTLWHLGNYVPYRRRATLHDAVDTDAFIAWRDEAIKGAQAKRAAGQGMENPNPR
jgi:ectoine hydroxylase-related dioxygenase (phytanoyl-CoA dioxygenase family)